MPYLPTVYSSVSKAGLQALVEIRGNQVKHNSMDCWVCQQQGHREQRSSLIRKAKSDPYTHRFWELGVKIMNYGSLLGKGRYGSPGRKISIMLIKTQEYDGTTWWIWRFRGLFYMAKHRVTGWRLNWKDKKNQILKNLVPQVKDFRNFPGEKKSPLPIQSSILVIVH